MPNSLIPISEFIPGMMFSYNFNESSSEPGVGNINASNTGGTSYDIYINDEDSIGNNNASFINTIRDNIQHIFVSSHNQDGALFNASYNSSISSSNITGFSASLESQIGSSLPSGVSIVEFSLTRNIAGSGGGNASNITGLTNISGSGNASFTSGSFTTLQTHDLIVTNEIDGTLTQTVNTDSNFSIGAALYISGSLTNDSKFRVSLANANNPSTMPVIGLKSGNNKAVTYGLLKNISDTVFDSTNASYEAGQTIYASASHSGSLTNVKPSNNSDLIQNIGILKKYDSNNSAIFITGIGRSNDIPNASLVNYSDMQYIYGKNSNDRFIRASTSNISGESASFISGSFTNLEVDNHKLSHFSVKHDDNTHNISGASEKHTYSNVLKFTGSSGSHVVMCSFEWGVTATGAFPRFLATLERSTNDGSSYSIVKTLGSRNTDNTMHHSMYSVWGQSRGWGQGNGDPFVPESFNTLLQVNTNDRFRLSFTKFSSSGTYPLQFRDAMIIITPFNDRILDES